MEQADGAMGKKKISMPEVERIVHGMIREHLKKRGLKGVLSAFDADCPRQDNSFRKSSHIAEALGSGGKKLYKQNKSSKKPLNSYLEVLGQHYYKKGKGEKDSATSKNFSIEKVPTDRKATKVEKTAPFLTSKHVPPPLPQSNIADVEESEPTAAPRINRHKSAGGGTYEFATDDLGLESFDVVEETLLVDKSNISKSSFKQPVSSNGFFKKSTHPENNMIGASTTNDFVMEDLDETDMYDFQ